MEPADRLEPVQPDPLATGDSSLATGHSELPTDTQVHPRYARLGADGLARLRARYAEVIARLDEKPLDPSVKEDLRAKADRLNPDAWGTEEEVADALEQYESVFEQLRPLVGRYPRRRRRRRV
jgi:hypothetical protein